MPKTNTQNPPSSYPCTQGWGWSGKCAPSQTWREDGGHLEESPVDTQCAFTKSLLWMEDPKSIFSCSPTPAQPAHFVTSLLQWSLKTTCVSFPFPGFNFKNNLAEPEVCSLSMPGMPGEVWWHWSGAQSCHKGFWAQGLGLQI